MFVAYKMKHVLYTAYHKADEVVTEIPALGNETMTGKEKELAFTALPVEM